MARYALVFVEFICNYLPSALVIFLIFCHIFPIYLGSHQPWTSRRIRLYFKYIFKIYLTATLVYIVICLPFAYFAFRAPKSNFNKMITQTRECAYQFKENHCTSSCVRRSICKRLERECFALAMCLGQPLFLLSIRGFLDELLAQIMNNGSSNIFLLLTGGYVGWGLVSGRWMVGQEVANEQKLRNWHVVNDTVVPEYSPIINHVAVPRNTPLVEADAPNNAILANDAPIPVINGGALGILQQPEEPLQIFADAA
jgi:hypothetical protein